jgi:hypothetical protein
MSSKDDRKALNLLLYRDLIGFLKFDLIYKKFRSFRKIHLQNGDLRIIIDLRIGQSNFR